MSSVHPYRNLQKKDSSELSELTPLQEHYLKKELLKDEIIKEFNKLSPTYNDTTGLRRFGPPFKMYDPKIPPKDLDLEEMLEISNSYVDHFNKEFPILRFVLENYIVTFPFIKMHLKKLGPTLVDQDTFWTKLQILFELWKSKKISNSNDRGQLSKRKLMLYKFRALFIMLFNSAIYCKQDDIYFEMDREKRGAYKKLSKLIDNQEQERLTKEVDQDVDVLDLELDEVSSNIDVDLEIDDDEYIDGWYVNVVGVTSESEAKAGFWGTKEFKYYSFIIRVKRKKDGESWYVKRRYSEFKEFHKQIKLLYPNKKFPTLPAKDKNETDMDLNSANDDDEPLAEFDSERFLNEHLDGAIDQPLSPSTTSTTSKASSFMKSPLLKSTVSFMPKSPSSLIPQSPTLNIGKLEKSFFHNLKIHSESSSDPEKITFPRESLRLALRGYLKNLLYLTEVTRSPEFLEFLTNNPIVPTESELNDIHHRIKLDHIILLQHFKFQKEIIQTVKLLEKHVVALKDEIYSQGFEYIFSQLRTKEKISELTSPLRGLIQMIELEVASTQYELLLGSDSANETLKLIKRLHSLFPYRILSTILRFTNPLQMVKKIIDLFTYQVPTGFGRKGKSLLQVIFTGILSDDMKKLDNEIEHVENRIKALGPGYDGIIEKIDSWFETNDENVLNVKKICKFFNIELCLGILLNENGLGIELPEDVIVELCEDYKEKVRRDGSAYTMSNLYFQSKLRRFDKNGMLELWEEPELMEMIKEILAIFFEPLIDLFKKAEVYKYVPILAKYIGELVDLCDFYVKDYGNFKRSNIVASFVGLEDAYSGYVYDFMHDLYLNDLQSEEGDRLFEGFLEWFNKFIRFLKFVKVERPDLKIDLNKILKEVDLTQKDKMKILSEVDDIVKTVQNKRELFEKMNETKVYDENDDSNIEKENDAMKKVRNKKLDKNWDKINDRVFKLTDAIRDSSSSVDDDNKNNGGVYSMVGLNDTEMEEMNMDIDEDYEEEEEQLDGAKKKFRDFDSVNQFLLAFYAEIRSRRGALESDVAFKAEEELEDIKKKQVVKLSGIFGEQLLEILSAFNKSG